MKRIFFTFTLIYSIFNYSVAQNIADKVIPDEVNKLVNPIPSTPTSIKRGSKIYTKACLLCHGAEGKGDGPQAADIETKPADFCNPTILNRTDGALFWWINEGGNDMEPFKDALPPDDIWNIVNFIRTLQNVPK